MDSKTNMDLLIKELDKVKFPHDIIIAKRNFITAELKRLEVKQTCMIHKMENHRTFQWTPEGDKQIG